jgi:hypothetical protein
MYNYACHQVLIDEMCECDSERGKTVVIQQSVL